MRVTGRLVALFTLLMALAAACASAPPPDQFTLADLPLGDGVEQSGELLMTAAEGLTPIAGDSAADPARALIAVHGGASRGYEWVYPLHRFVESGFTVYFYRWDWKQCPLDAALELDEQLRALVAEQPGISELVLVSHSLGGVVGAMLAALYSGTVPIEVNVIAAPLASTSERDERCGTSRYTPQPGVTLVQWRTRKDLDGAFKDLPADPQLVQIVGATVVVLPESYEGDRLGHNRSISHVADEMVR